jgi:hypothetical protein
MKKLKKTQVTIHQAIDKLDVVFSKRSKLAEKYSKSNDPYKQMIAQHLETNLVTLVEVKCALLNMETMNLENTNV